jgi:uncharacterized membrane protein
MQRSIPRISMILGGLGLLVSAYMTVYKLTDNQTMCLGSGDCSVVNSSVYSTVYGVPVALIGVAGYAAILAVHAFESRSRRLGGDPVLVSFGLCFAGFLFTLYLIYVEVVLIRALCPFCVASQVIMTLLFVLATLRLARHPID